MRIDRFRIGLHFPVEFLDAETRGSQVLDLDLASTRSLLKIAPLQLYEYMVYCTLGIPTME